jgi:DUF1009 family protein
MAQHTTPESEGAASLPPIAIVCGGGRLPLQVAEAAVARGRRVLLLGFTGIADPAIARFPHAWVKLGQARLARRLVAEHGCREMCFIGVVMRPKFSSIRFDWDSIRYAAKVARLFIGGDDRLLTGLIDLVEREGDIKVVAAHDVAPEILAPDGQFGRRAPSAQDLADIRIGMACLQAMGAHDIGQGVVVGRGHVLAVEAAEGTDAMLERVAELRRRGRIKLPEGVGVLVKAPKTAQDRRVDLPALGPLTVENAARAGLAGIAVVAGASVIADPQELVSAADRGGLFVIGVPEAAPP